MLTRAEWIYFALLLLALFGLCKAKQWVAAQNRAYHAAMLNSGCRDSCGRPDAFLLLAALLPSDCGRKNETIPPDRQQRWEELRRQLQQTLGEKYKEFNR
jgi:hypothetical protein